MLLTAILEMIFYYTGSSLSLGTVLAIGLLFLLIMAIIKTGQDLFLSEKKKQQAITAREAQAKFLANMSHEIRTPINAIIGMNEMILRENENEAIQDYAHNIQSASDMLLGLVNDVLDFSKIESGQLELIEDTYHLATLLQAELLLLRARTGDKPLSTLIDIDPKLPSKLLGDELRIKQILTNLLSNAVKYTLNGSVTLKVFFQPIDTQTIKLCFSIIDTGIGIRKEDLPKLFDSFKRLELNKNRTIQGTGLGLNIAKQLVESMQGTIVVESEYGKGSTFTISIPQKIMDAQPIGNLEDTLDKLRKEKTVPKTLFTAPDASILIVDDNSTNLILMKGLLKRTKANVTLASSGQKCLDLTKANRYDIIFMDHMMPELDGVETLHRLRADSSNPNQNALVIALTANAIAGCKEMYAAYGFNDYFAKPVQADKLEELLINHLPKELVHLTDQTDFS
jgi:signal transduction histidine kinase/ActR/RegA family two-component response regulator